MELVTKKRLHLFTGPANPALASDIAGHFGNELGIAGIIDLPNC